MTTENTNAHALSAAQLDKIAAESRQRHLSPTEVAALLAMARRTLAAERVALAMREAMSVARASLFCGLGWADDRSATSGDRLVDAAQHAMASLISSVPRERAEMAEARLAAAEAKVARLEEASRPRPLNDWHEDCGAVLWWKLPVSEPPYAGTPLDFDFPGYQTHWTPIVVPVAPPAAPAPMSAKE